MTGEGQSALRPQSLFYQLMDFTVEMAKTFNLSPFSVLEQDKDHVIMLINYFIEKGQNDPQEQEQTHKTENKRARAQNGRIRVNDKTATGGWF